MNQAIHRFFLHIFCTRFPFYFLKNSHKRVIVLFTLHTATCGSFKDMHRTRRLWKKHWLLKPKYKKKETFSHSYPKDRRSVLEEVVFMQALSTARKSREKSQHKSSSCQRGSWRGVSRAVSCVQSAGERKHLSAAMRQMAVDSRHSLQSQRRRQRCRANIRALIYSLAVSLSRLGCIDKCVITLIHAHSFIKKLEGRLWGTC